ncbi:MAG: DEAD/DEAH box helicase, partial [Spirochaetota bacterium]
MQEFKILGLRDEVAVALASFGFEGPTEIQSLAIPVLMDRKDAHISSATGSGKTFAFLGPILSTMDPSMAAIQTIIVAPTHDLSAQLFRETERLIEASGLPFKVVQAIGSIPLHRQLERLAIKPQIVIGSAGRMRDLALSGKMNLDTCIWAILDEADRLFENEAIDLTGELLNALPEECTRVLVSATIPERTAERASRWFRSPVKLALDSAEALKTSIEHWCFHASSRSKLEYLRRFEASVKPERCLLFASSNASIFTIAKKLEYLG